MAKGRLYEVVDRPLSRWTFLGEDLIYLAAFADEERARFYAGLNGYATDDPPKIRGSAVDAAQPELPQERIPAANSAIPDLRGVLPKKEPSKPMPVSSSFQSFGTKK